MRRLDKKLLRRLSDEELQQEALRRRRARARRTAGSGDATESYAKKVLQFYANLELPVGASLAEIEEAYARLRAKYDPTKHLADPEKREAAERLMASLTRAYEGLRAHRARGSSER